MSDISILGSGGFGCALAVMCEKMGHKVTVWSPFEEEIETLKRDGEHKKLLSGVPISKDIHMTTDMSNLQNSAIVILAVPSFAVRATAKKLSAVIDAKTIVANVAKGLEDNTLLRLSEVISEELPHNPVVALSGPSHAEEVGRGLATTVVSAGQSREAVEMVQDNLMNSALRIYTNSDIIGVEIGAAVKNVIALSAGICDGVQLGDNAKAALVTRGITETARLGVAMGAKKETFAGLSGIGDLVVTCTSMHSRNRRAGILMGQGTSPEQVLKEVGTVEGYYAAKNVQLLAQKYNVEMPITRECCHVLYDGKNPLQAVRDLMERPKAHETEVTWIE